MPEPAYLGGALAGGGPTAASAYINSGNRSNSDLDALEARLRAVQANALGGINGLLVAIAVARSNPNASAPSAQSNYLMSVVDEISLRVSLAEILQAKMRLLPTLLQAHTTPERTIAVIDTPLRQAIDKLKATVVTAWNQRKAAADAQAAKAAANRAAVMQRLGR